MSSLLLQINMDLQNGAALTALKAVESSVDIIIGKLQQFSKFFQTNPINVVQSSQIGVVNDLLNAVKQIDDRGLSVNKSSVEELAHRREILDSYVKQANELKKINGHVDGLLDAQKKLDKLNHQFGDFFDDARKFHKDQKDQLNKLLKNKNYELVLTKSQHKEFEKYVKALDVAVKLGGDHLTQLGMTVNEAKELLKATEGVKFSAAKQVDIWKTLADTAMGFLALLPTAGILMMTLTKPTEVLKSSFTDMYEMWKKNNQVSNNFLTNANDKAGTLSQTMMKMKSDISSAGGGLADQFKKLDIQLGDNTVTFEQAGEAVNAVLASSFKSVAKESKDAAGELSMYASIIAQSSRATGINVGQTTELMLKTGALGVATSNATTVQERHNDGLKAAAQLNAVLVNATEKFGMSIDEVSHASQILNRNLNLLKTSFKGNTELLKAGIPVSSQYTSMLFSLGKAAKDAGYDSKLAMDAFASGLEKPMDNILLLGSAMMSSDPSVQMTAMGENAIKAADMMAGKPLVIQQMLAGMYGKTVDELNAMAKAQKGLNEKYKDLSPQERLVKINKEMADQASADAVAKKAQTDANANLEKSLDHLKIAFGQIASALQPVIDGIAWILNSKFAAWTIIATGAVASLVAAIGGGMMLWKFSKALDAVGESTGKITGMSKPGGGLKGIADGIKGFINTLGEINWMGVVKAAAVIGLVGLVGAELAGVIYLFNKASAGMTWKQVGIVGAIVGGLVGIMALLGLMAPLAVPAIIGAVALAAVGVALGVGLLLIGAASRVIDPDIGDKFKGLATGIGWLALTAVTGPLALIGAVAMAAAAPLFAFSMLTLGAATALFGEGVINTIAGLADAVSMIPAGAGAALIGMAAGLTAFAAALAGGAIFSFFSGGMVNNANMMATAMSTLLGPIMKLGSIGDQVSKSFVSIAEGLKVFVGAINDSSGWFSSFEGKAERVASAMRKIAEPMKEMGGNPVTANSEEIQKGLAVTINESSDKSLAVSKAIHEELKEIKTLLATNSDKALAEKMSESVGVLNKILEELSISSGFGTSSANSNY